MRIKILVMDVDGTLTDGKIYMGNDGELFKAFHIKDGCGIHDILPSAGIIPVIITGRKSKILENRCRELDIQFLYQGVTDKIRKLDEVLSASCCEYRQVAYMGDDLNDLQCMETIQKAGGLVGCPADAADSVRQIADFISLKNGGDGAVRTFIEWIVLQEKTVCSM